jgi:hypothetical protein
METARDHRLTFAVQTPLVRGLLANPELKGSFVLSNIPDTNIMSSPHLYRHVTPLPPPH